MEKNDISEQSEDAVSQVMAGGVMKNKWKMLREWLARRL